MFFGVPLTNVSFQVGLRAVGLPPVKWREGRRQASCRGAAVGFPVRFSPAGQTPAAPFSCPCR